MRQAVEAQVLTSHSALGEHDLRQILSDVIEEVRHSINKDIDGAEVLNSLLNAPWLPSLLKVYQCLQRFKLEQPASYLNYASGLSLQLVLDIASLPGSSEEAQELCRLLRRPHFQALLSAHDTVAQKDYDPVLPPMPEELPDHEEATRVVCLVKNKQPLRCKTQGTGLALHPDSSLPPHAPTKSPLGGIRGQWATLKRLTHRRLSRGGGGGTAGQDVTEQSKPQTTARRGSLLSWGEPVPRPPPPVPPYPPPSSRYNKPTGNCRVCFRSPVSPCRSCYANSLWEKSHSSPLGCSRSLLMDDGDSLDLDSPSGSPRTHCTPTSCTPTHCTPTSCTPPYCTPTSCPQRPGTGTGCSLSQCPGWSLSPAQPCRSPAGGSYSTLDAVDRGLRTHSAPCCGFRTTRSLCVRTAPPSPMTPRQHHHHQGGPRGGVGVMVDFPRRGLGPPVELAKQESLDELRSAVRTLAADSMASGSEDVRRLGEKMAAATERASESARDNARALELLAAVVGRLQGLVEGRAEEEEEEEESRVPPTPPPRANRKARDGGEQRDPRQRALMASRSARSRSSGMHVGHRRPSVALTGPSLLQSGPSLLPSTPPCSPSRSSLCTFGRGGAQRGASKALQAPPSRANGPRRLSNGLSEPSDGSAECPVTGGSGGLPTRVRRRKKNKTKAT